MTKLSAILSLTIGALTPAAYADTVPWRFGLPVFLTAGTYVQETPESIKSFNALSAFFEFRLWSPGRPWSTALFVDYRFPLDEHNTDTLKAGMLIRHRHNDWDTLAAIFRSQSPGTPSAWGYAGRIRYRLADSHKIGVESFGNHNRLDTSYLMLGYYGDVSRDVSWQLVAGSNLGTSRDRAARAELVWQIN